MIRWVLLALVLAAPVVAQDRAVVEADTTRVEVDDDSAVVELALSRAVPWRLTILDTPWRLIVDLTGGDFSQLAPGDLGDGVIWGRVGPMTSRLVVPLPSAMGVEMAVLETGRHPRIRITLDEDVMPVLTDRPVAAEPPSFRVTPAEPRPLIVALDPGHGGIDPGAERGGAKEAELTLRFARELAVELDRKGYQVVFTRDEDTFVSLRGRAAIARAGGADIMISLHADAVAGGGASGATAYTLAPSDGDAITAELAERHGRGDLLRGVELEGEGDEIARVLIDLARAQTGPRADALAGAIIASMGQAGLRLHKRPRLGAEFTVLKTPDIPTVLLELGFMSDPRDLENLLSRDWRARTAVAVARAVETWERLDTERAERRLR